jgi:hypothetical protein
LSSFYVERQRCLSRLSWRFDGSTLPYIYEDKESPKVVMYENVENEDVRVVGGSENEPIKGSMKCDARPFLVTSWVDRCGTRAYTRLDALFNSSFSSSVDLGLSRKLLYDPVAGAN